MPEYGLTPNGPNIKRLDVIIEELHKNLSEKWGVNTRQNPESFLNHFLTNIADRCAELWEFGEDIYYAMYPASAEGRSLDNAAQYGGSTRETAAKSYYPIHCTGTDGTTLAAGTIISSTTNPTTQLSLTSPMKITRSSFNKAGIKVASAGAGNVYTAAINGAVYSYSSQETNAISILRGLAAIIIDEGFTVSVNETDEILNLESKDPTSANVLVLSENLTTETVTSVIVFGTVETGDILLPDGVITNIVKADAGLQKVVNICGYIAGRDEETDAEFRQSYADKIFNRSSRMLESIRSAILNKVQGVKSVAVYENDTNVTDAAGRPPHSVEVVVDGGDKNEIAEQILDKKAGGISTYCVEGENGETVILKGLYGEDITIRFNRPTDVYIWFRVGVTFNSNTNPPSNYAELIKETVLKCMDDVGAGSDVVPQKFIDELHKTVPGIDYFDIRLCATRSASESPTDYPERSVSISERERAVTSESRIGVVIDG